MLWINYNSELKSTLSYDLSWNIVFYIKLSYTLGQYTLCKNYYFMVLSKYPKHTRALWGMNQTLQKLKDKQMILII